MTGAIYNENDGYAAAWLANLIRSGCVAPGRVDQRSIVDINPGDVNGSGQRHFFGGIGGWSYSLRLADVPDDADIWTGSCPCQPFSSAGKRGGTSDPRHLWPTWCALIRECRPPIIFGEQVASGDGVAWLDAVFSDLERHGYTVGAADLCAASVGAPHMRQRLFFVAYADGERLERLGVRLREWRSREAPISSCRATPGSRDDPDGARREGAEIGGTDRRDAGAGEAPHEWGPARSLESQRTGAGIIGVGDAESDGRIGGRALAGWSGQGDRTPAEWDRSAVVGNAGELGHASGAGSQGGIPGPHRITGAAPARGLGHTGGDRTGEHVGELPSDESEHGERSAYRDHASFAPGPTRGFWHPAEWLPCIDGTFRPVEPGLEPLAHGVSGRVAVRRTDRSTGEEIEHLYNRSGALSGFGNAIVTEAAAAFIVAALEARGLT